MTCAGRHPENRVSQEKSSAQTGLGRISAVLAEIVVAIYLVLDGVIGPIFRPLSRWLKRLALVQRIERAIGALPPYGVLVLLAVPFVLAEPAKIYALFLIGQGHIILGLVALAGAYLVSVVVVDRIFEAGKAKLMTIGWFATLYRWFAAYRDRLFAYMRESRLWQSAKEARERVKAWFAQWRQAPR